MYDLAIAYRIYPGVSKMPAYCSTDKFKLAEMCLRSFRAALGELRFKIWALLDGCPPEYEALFRDVFKGNELEIVALNKVGNLKSFSAQIDILTKQTEADYVYFAEDDYYYLPDALVKMIAFMRNNKDVDFVTSYDHPDSYDTSFRYERHLVRPYGDRYWRTASSTCLTFLTSRKNLIRNKWMFRTYTRFRNYDYSLWLALTQKLSMADLRIYWSDVLHVKIWIKTLVWGFGSVFFGRYYRLWCPLPTLSTHMESTRLSPLVNWPELFQNYDRSKHQAGQERRSL